MNTFAVIFLCVQACLVQNVFSQCLGRPGIAPYGNGIATPAYGMFLDAIGGIGAYGYGPEIAGIDAIAQYGGAGEGNVAVAGELPVAGTTAVAGQVPIMGAVRFGGDVAAAGAVTITGQCACSPAVPLEYLY